MSERRTILSRSAISLAALGVVFGALWLLLPVVRAWMLPRPGGTSGLLWVIGPARALRFGASAILSAVSLPFLLRPLGQRWRAQDLAARGAPLDPFARRPGTRIALLIKGALLAVVYGVCGASYFTAHGEVRESQVAFHSLLGARSYTYDRVAALEHQAPVGGQVDRYGISLDDGSWGYFDADCEGLDEADVRAIAAHVARRSGRRWVETTRP